MSMKLKALYISRHNYGAQEGRYTGSASFDSQFGEVSLNLDPEVSDRLLRVLGGALVSSSKSIAQALSLSAIASHGALEHKPDAGKDDS